MFLPVEQVPVPDGLKVVVAVAPFSLRVHQKRWLIAIKAIRPASSKKNLNANKTKRLGTFIYAEPFAITYPPRYPGR